MPLARFPTRSPHQPVIEVLVDPDTLRLCHQFGLLDDLGELQQSRGQAEREGRELISSAIEIKPEVFPRPWTYGNMEVSVAEIQRCDPLPFLKGESDGLWGFHFEGG